MIITGKKSGSYLLFFLYPTCFLLLPMVSVCSDNELLYKCGWIFAFWERNGRISAFGVSRRQRKERHMTLVVLAAGLGSRYGGLKQLDPVGPCGEFIIDYSIYDAIRAGYDKVVFIIKRENYELFRSTIGHRLEKVVAVEYAFQEPDAATLALLPKEREKPLGTAHALLCARPYVKGNFSVINADDYYGCAAYGLAAEYLKSASAGTDMHYCMVGYNMANTLTDNGTVSRGVCTVRPDGMLESITERTKIRRAGSDGEYEDGGNWIRLPGDTIVSMNFFGFNDSIFAYAEKGLTAFLHRPGTDLMKGEYYLPTVAGESLEGGAHDMRVLVTPDVWYGVTYKEDKPTVVAGLRALAEAGVYPKDSLWEK